MVDKAGSHTNPKVTGDVLSKAGNFRTTVLIMTILFCIYTVLCWLFVLLMCGVGFLTKFIYDEHQREELKKKMANVPLAKQAIEKTTKK